MRPGRVVVQQVLGQHPSQVVVIDDQQPVEEFPAQGAGDPFADRIRSGRLRRAGRRPLMRSSCGIIARCAPETCGATSPRASAGAGGHRTVRRLRRVRDRSHGAPVRSRVVPGLGRAGNVRIARAAPLPRGRRSVTPGKDRQDSSLPHVPLHREMWPSKGPPAGRHHGPDGEVDLIVGRLAGLEHRTAQAAAQVRRHMPAASGHRQTPGQLVVELGRVPGQIVWCEAERRRLTAIRGDNLRLGRALLGA